MAEFNESPMRELEIETDGFHIHLSKNENTFKPQGVLPQAPQAETPSPKVEEASEQAQAASYIKAPMVGSIYLQPAPEKEAYVSVGTKVHKATWFASSRPWRWWPKLSQKSMALLLRY